MCFAGDFQYRSEQPIVSQQPANSSSHSSSSSSSSLKCLGSEHFEHEIQLGQHFQKVNSPPMPLAIEQTVLPCIDFTVFANLLHPGESANALDPKGEGGESVSNIIDSETQSEVGSFVGGGKCRNDAETKRSETK